MIVEINGKKLAFGLEWRLLVSTGTPAALATDQALAAQAPLLWHDGRRLYAGLMPRASAPAGSGPLYAAAAAFLRVPGLPADALLMLRMADNHYAMIGIKEGRPRRGFDQAGLNTAAVRERYEQFGRLCGDTGFAVVGDPTLPFVQKATPFTFEELVALADPSCALKPPSRAAKYRMLAGTVVAAAVIVLYGPAWWRTYISPPLAQETHSPTQQYQQFVERHLSDPMVRATDYHAWYQWVRRLAPAYGGWSLQSVDCDFRHPQSQAGIYLAWDGQPRCSLTFNRALKAIATNETFLRAAPQEWRTRAVYHPSADEMRVMLQPKIFAPTALRAILQKAGRPSDRDVHFVSRLQHVGTMAKAVNIGTPAPFLIPPGVQRSNVKGPVYITTRWHLSGQLHYIDLLSTFPPYATFSKATLTLEKHPAHGETPFHVALSGDIITRN